MDDGNRVKVQLNLDRALVDKAEAEGVDVSHVVERALRDEVRRARKAAMTHEEREDLLRQISEEIASRNKMIEEDGLFGQEWRTF